MPVESYVDQLEPENQDAVIWRFVNMEKFRDLITTGELYFCRSDLFPNDEKEGLALEEYLPMILGLDPRDLRDRQELNHHIGCHAQFREAYFISCWHLFREETSKMWKQYGEDGVAICSRYRLLRSALDSVTDRASLGLVRYGVEHLLDKKFNTFQFIMTKRPQYADDKEVRAALWIMDPHAGINRHFDLENRAHPRPLTPPPPTVLNGHRRKVDLEALVTEIVVTPWASSTTLDEIIQLVRTNGYAIPVLPSALAAFRKFLPDD